ncbi:MAG: DUF1780 domain-containing protein [Gammaproteobacteria bacterium]|nr:DUF1780 domain-containing protein [Gammaproteobacteria bacterium]MBU0850167.1 DUF1780 domain-containing protein [Gammaproteobacteria bacterium]MBU1780862.1 DUF1780 domain-containing protein [Gammaproteobacteria bacterium]MBU2087319.1 DUF1780 domain-containing protein [Gammaproteobacteria bacterium]MBU2130087.1 DUF1780 domain-containing protein [Gammaproteobacteria bacterium]
MPESDAEILIALRESASAELEFFSNKGKEERERWVVLTFLQRRSIAFVESEVTSPEQNSEKDVCFGNASFQIKEIVNPGLRRGADLKADYERLKSASKLDELVGPASAYDVPQPTTVYSLVLGEATALARDPKYATTKANLDLLFYVTRSRAALIREAEVDRGQLQQLGWRSISCLAGEQASILFARPDAPAFLRTVK